MVSFYEEAVTESCRQGLVLLRDQDLTQGFYLAGGTALALQIGHRISTDLDFVNTLAIGNTLFRNGVGVRIR